MNPIKVWSDVSENVGQYKTTKILDLTQDLRPCLIKGHKKLNVLLFYYPEAAVIIIKTNCAPFMSI